MRQWVLGIFLLFSVATVQAEPPFALTDINSVKHRLADYRGKWLLVNYWATWCPPCLEEVPDLVNLYDQRRDKDLMVLGVVFEFQNIQEVEKFADDMLMSYPIVPGNERIVREIGSAAVLPTTYIFNPQGGLVKIKRGLITRQYIEELIAGGSR